MVTETRTLPAEFIEALGKTYADTLTKTTGTPITTTDVSAQLVKGELDADRLAQGLAAETDAEFAARQAGAKQTAREFDIRKAQMADLAPTVAGMDQLQLDAITKATGATGLGAYQQYLTDAATAAGQAGTTLGGVAGDIGAARTGLTGAGTTLGQVDPFITAAGTGLAGAGTTLGQVDPFITAAGTGLGTAGQTLAGAVGLTGTGAGTGAGSLASYMSPYQQQVIDTTLAEFDRQRQIQEQGIAQSALRAGAFGGGREGVQLAEFQSASDRNRAATQAQLLQAGYGQAQAARQADLQNRSGLASQQAALAQSQLGLGQAKSNLAAQQAALASGQLGLGQAKSGLAAQQAQLASGRLGLGAAQQALAQSQLGQGAFQQGLGGFAQQAAQQEIAGLGALGSVRQAQAQAEADATRQAAQMAAYEPMQRTQQFGTGVTGLMGGYPGSVSYAPDAPQASPLSSALQIGTGLASIYGNVFR